MLETDANLYLPISANALLSVVAEDVELMDVVTTLSVYEVASLFFLMYMPQIQLSSGSKAERVLFEAIKTCKELHDQSGREAFYEHLSAHLDKEAIVNGYFLLPEYSIVPMDEQVLEGKHYLDTDGLWDYEFCPAHRQELAKNLVEVNLTLSTSEAPITSAIAKNTMRLSDEQSRLYRELMADSDEHIHIQGYAGTGKTSLVKSLLTKFESSNAKVLVLAERQVQLDVFKAFVEGVNSNNGRTKVLSYVDFAKLIISENSTSMGEETILRKGIARATMPDAEIIRHLGIRSTGTNKASQIVKAVRGTVFRYCKTSDEEVGIEHIPKSYLPAFSPATQGAVSHYAQSLWASLLAPPTKEFTAQIRAYHIIKWAALNRCTVPEDFTHVLIDECHDLPQPIDQILSVSPQARLSMGDDYQNLSGTRMNQLSFVRHREMHHSLRSSHQVESLINPIITVHPSKIKNEFFGNRMNRLNIEYYERAAIPDVPSLILVNDLWGLFEWSQRLAAKKLSINMMGNATDLDTFVQDCIELYTTGTRARHGELFRFSTWEQVQKHYQDNPAFQRVNRMLEKKYSYEDWQQTSGCFSNASERVAYAIALIENVRNLEFDNVLLTPQIVTRSSTNKASAAYYSGVYVSVTRAKKRLMLPQTLRNQIEELS